MQVIPAIDIFDGRCVRLSEGSFTQRTTYSPDPFDMASAFAEAGAACLHVVDLEGAKEGRVTNWASVERILSLKSVSVQVGGGIRTEAEAERLVTLGAAYIVVGSAAIRTPAIFDAWIRRFGPRRFCLAVDVRDGQIAVEGWQQPGGRSIHDIVAEAAGKGIRRFLSTDIRRDGMLGGPNLELYRTLVRDFPDLEWIASGGVRSKADISSLEQTGVAGVVVGKALYEGGLALKDLG